MSKTNDHGRSRVSRYEAAVLCALLLASLWCWREARALESKRDAHSAMEAQLERMTEDADGVLRLRTAPRIAVERERPNDELLAEIRDAMERADIPEDLWIGNDPLPPMRIPQSPYKRLATRLRFEALPLKGLVQFAFHLTHADPALSVSSLRLNAPRGRDDDTWDVDLTLSYLIYSPYSE